MSQYKRSELESILEGLKVLYDCPKYITAPRYGICCNLSDYVGFDCYKFVEKYSVGWKHHSGSIVFPVPSYESRNYEDIWDKDTEYGRMRYKLVKYLIKKLEKELLNEN